MTASIRYIRSRLTTLINRARINNRLSRVTLNAPLNQAAQRHSHDVGRNDLVVGHRGSNGSTPGQRVRALGYQHRTLVENVAAGDETADQVFRSWMQSPGHRANILNSTVRNLGVGHFYLRNDTGRHNYFDYWTIVLGNRAQPSRSVSPAKTSQQSVSVATTPTAPISSIAENSTSTVQVTPDSASTNPTPAEPAATSSVSTSASLASDLSQPEASSELISVPEASRSVSGSAVNSSTVEPETTQSEDTVAVEVSPTADTVSVVEASETVGAAAEPIAGGLGDDQIMGSRGDDILRGDLNQRDPGGSVGGDDTIWGQAGDDRIGGKGGDDILFGGEGNDAIWGDDGDDILRGGLGHDSLTGDNFSGGSGTDTFVLAAGEGMDTIKDFEVGIDLIGLADGLTFADLSLGQRGNATIISAGDEVLAQVNNVAATDMMSEMFILVA